ncbi:hypothetical protein PGT21_000070 [Puccinia graminis f. sp. tritici]|uniref:Uncharacterized protein n=1 Tax=Puccinia graminis f. sp. tritici TaxID=56615 RepID=A0A5B0QDP7_PUCGR|nr:hypothetical protein PGT21_000070 [Puccinia graminis f. sp. tritici]
MPAPTRSHPGLITATTTITAYPGSPPYQQQTTTTPNPHPHHPHHQSHSASSSSASSASSSQLSSPSSSSSSSPSLCRHQTLETTRNRPPTICFLHHLVSLSVPPASTLPLPQPTTHHQNYPGLSSSSPGLHSLTLSSTSPPLIHSTPRPTFAIVAPGLFRSSFSLNLKTLNSWLKLQITDNLASQSLVCMVDS